MATLFGLHPFLLKLYADGGYQGPQFQGGLRRIMRHVDVEIVKRSDAAKGFTVLPKRWIVERTIAWLNRCRRLAKDWECLNRRALAFLRWASVRRMLRRLCQKPYDPGWTLSAISRGMARLLTACHDRGVGRPPDEERRAGIVEQRGQRRAFRREGQRLQRLEARDREAPFIRGGR